MTAPDLAALSAHDDITDAMIEAGEEFIAEKLAHGCRVYAADVYEAMTKARAEAADEIERLTAQVEGCTIMAEGFKARVAELTAKLAEARESERAAVVAYLRKAADEADVKATMAETPESVRNWCATNITALHLAKTIEAGEHLT